MNKKTLWVVVIILALVGGYFWMQSDATLDDLGSLGSNTASPSPSASVKAGATTKSKTATPAPAADNRTYTQLVTEYDGRTVRLDSQCKMNPTTFVLKNNNGILLDNRANVARTIKLDGKAYQLGAYGYQVVTLSSPTLPHTVKIDCGATYNVGTIMLEANISGQ